MQALQPVHFFTSTITAPFSALCEAPEGQVSMQGASWQWRHILGKKKRFTSGYSPTSLSSTRLKKTPGGVLLAALQARVQAGQPIQRSRSITIPYLVMNSSLGFVLRVFFC